VYWDEHLLVLISKGLYLFMLLVKETYHC